MEEVFSRGKEVQKCNEFGTVVVQITVNRNGNVIAAIYQGNHKHKPMPCGTSIGNSTKIQMALIRMP
jgi:hypothetical protein